ncbi:P-loop NTPase domain-containing protein [Rhizobium phage RHph_I72]|nr:P-loop NTPase domain-containing protein [Rhizobium phage RHph_I65]QIG76452.1 P-loop NTPase domain-containing protein [Rhizobium phage RHph_I72]
MIINIRGTNGSGKTTLARTFQDHPSARVVNLVDYAAPTKKDPEAIKFVTGVVTDLPGVGSVCCVGSYSQAQGGLDTVPNFELQRMAIAHAAAICDHVVCEGILASTVAGSFVEFFTRMQIAGHKVAVCYLDTPLQMCLDRIKARQEKAGKVRDIKTDQVADKVKAIAATRAKFDAAGIPTYTLFSREDMCEAQLHVIMGEQA